jgi:hypothetical protein
MHQLQPRRRQSNARRPGESAAKAVSSRERRLDDMLADSFPASDPPCFGLPA